MNLFRNARRMRELEYDPYASPETEIEPQDEAVAFDDRKELPASKRYVSKAAPTPSEQCTSVIAARSTWQGTFQAEDSVRIEGRISGEIKAGGTIHVAEGAEVDAQVEAAYVVIAGSFQGHVHCGERLELMPTSHIKGEFTTKLLTVHEGAFIDGQLHMVRDEQPGLATRVSSSSKGDSVSLKTPRDVTDSVLKQSIEQTNQAEFGKEIPAR